MAIRLLAALIALGLLHIAPQLADWRRDGLFRRWVAQLSDTGGAGRVVLALLPPLVLCLLLAWLCGHTLLGELPRLLFALAVLLYCFGPREFERDLEAILAAPDGLGREAAAQALADDGRPVAWNAPALGEAIVYAALRRRFAVLLWFFLLGPVGALLYRLAQRSLIAVVFAVATAGGVMSKTGNLGGMGMLGNPAMMSMQTQGLGMKAGMQMGMGMGIDPTAGAASFLMQQSLASNAALSAVTGQGGPSFDAALSEALQNAAKAVAENLKKAQPQKK